MSLGCSRRKGLEMALEKWAGGEGYRASLWELRQEVWALSRKGRGTREEGKPKREMIRLEFQIIQLMNELERDQTGAGR